MNSSNFKGKESISEINAIMTERLTQFGFPHVPKELILQELKPLYLLLEERSLAPMSFEEFEQIATFQYMMAELI